MDKNSKALKSNSTLSTKSPLFCLVFFYADAQCFGNSITHPPIHSFTRQLVCNEIDPEFSAAYFRRGRALASLNKSQDALKDFDKAIKLDPTFSRPYLSRGYTLLKLGQTEQALEDFKKAASLGDNDAKNYLKKKGMQW